MKQNFLSRILKYSGLMLSIVYLYFFTEQIDIGLTYYWQQTVAMSFGEYLSYPGGISDYLGIKLIELFTFSIGGFIGTAILVLLAYFTFARIFKQYAKQILFPTLILAALIPVFLLFVHYRIPVGLLLSLHLGLLIAFVTSFFKPENTIVYILFIGFSAIAAYMLAGPVGLYVMAQVWIIDIVVSRKYIKFIYALPFLFIIPIAYFLLINNSLTLWTAFTRPFYVEVEYVIPAVFYIGLLIPMGLLILFEGLKHLSGGGDGSKHGIVNRIGIIAVLIILVYSSWTSIDDETKLRLQLDQASFDDEWQEVLELGDYQLCANRIVQYQVNRALYYRGTLLHDLFKYPQIHGDKGIFLEDIPATRVALVLADFYYDMGFANEARHWSNESHAARVRHPLVLERLIITYGAIGSEKTALKFNEVLSKSGLYRDWCDSISTMIQEDRLHEVPQAQSFIRNNPRYEFFANRSEPFAKLASFYRQNPNNHMAFEYVMAGYLLQHDVGKIMKHLPDFRRFRYEKLPRAIEEAVLIFLAQSKEENVNLYGYDISKQTTGEFTDYLRLRSSSTNKEEVRSKLRMYGHTYWYYLMFTSPLAK